MSASTATTKGWHRVSIKANEHTITFHDAMADDKVDAIEQCLRLWPNLMRATGQRWDLEPKS